MSLPLLHLKGISKNFSGTVALDEVSLTVFTGEILALVGENGAGKSTLMKILAGIILPHAGEIFFEGKSRTFRSAKDAIDSGIILIHQEINLCDNLSITQNLFLGRELTTFGILARRQMTHETQEALERVGLAVSPDTQTGSLSTAEKQLVEIARAISMQAKVIVMDEPTASLSGKESARLFEIIQELKQKGVAIIYISHRLPEVLALADRVIVLRDGRWVGEVPREALAREVLIHLMAGRTEGAGPVLRTPGAETFLALENFTTNQFPTAAVSFSVQSGEIVGLAGLVGAGRSALLETLFGLRPALGGKIVIRGRDCSISSPKGAIANGIGFVPEDRKEQGLVLEMSIAQNLLMAKLFRICCLGFRKRRREFLEASAQRNRFGIKCDTLQQRVSELSGGNQQKVVMSKWIGTSPKLLLLDEPTRGVDVGSKEDIYTILEDIAEQGVAICVASSDQEELLRLCDRIIVLCDGKVTGELTRATASESKIISLAIQSEHQ